MANFSRQSLCPMTWSDSIPQEVYHALIPPALPNGAIGAAEEAEAKFLHNSHRTAMLGRSDVWRKCSHRPHVQAQAVSERVVYMARHCVEHARSSGGRVH
eukprot:6003052-Pyramimonas_sp.AAC.1